MADTTTVGSEFQALPLDFIVAAPLVAAVQAQATIAATTKSFLQGVANQSIAFKSQVEGADGKLLSKEINVPLVACVPVPHLRIDSLTTHFKFEINQIVKTVDSTKGNVEGSIGGSGIASLLNMSLKGGLSHESSRESTTNRSGMLEITVHASEAEMPAGLQKILTWMTSGIQEGPASLPAQAQDGNVIQGEAKQI
jgi:hypothetical protein